MTYEYVCTACQHSWEADQSIKEPPLRDCPNCHGQTAKRQISGGTGFVLKGGGWYADLYSSSSAKKTADKADAVESKSDSKSTDAGTKTESTSDGGTGTKAPKADSKSAA